MWTAFPPADYYANSATPRAHQPASGLAGPPPAARRARGASHVHHDPFDRVGSWLYPYSISGEYSQSLAGHHAQIHEPDVERAAVNQGDIVAVNDPCPPGFGSFTHSRGFDHQFASALPFGLASTHAGVWQCRPAVTSSGTLHPEHAIPRPRWTPASPGRCISPGLAFQPARMRCCLPSSPFAWRLVAQGVSARDRRRGDHPHRPRAARADDPRNDRPAAMVLITTLSGGGPAPAAGSQGRPGAPRPPGPQPGAPQRRQSDRSVCPVPSVRSDRPRLIVGEHQKASRGLASRLAGDATVSGMA
jgi:hypothetical protein